MVITMGCGRSKASAKGRDDQSRGVCRMLVVLGEIIKSKKAARRRRDVAGSSHGEDA